MKCKISCVNHYLHKMETRIATPATQRYGCTGSCMATLYFQFMCIVYSSYSNAWWWQTPSEIWIVRVFNQSWFSVNLKWTWPKNAYCMFYLTTLLEYKTALLYWSICTWCASFIYCTSNQDLQSMVEPKPHLSHLWSCTLVVVLRKWLQIFYDG